MKNVVSHRLFYLPKRFSLEKFAFVFFQIMSLPDKYEEENAHLMRYAAEKSKNVKSPLSIAKLCKQFKEESGSDKTMECLRQRLMELTKISTNFLFQNPKTSHENS